MVDMQLSSRSGLNSLRKCSSLTVTQSSATFGLKISSHMEISEWMVTTSRDGQPFCSTVRNWVAKFEKKPHCGRRFITAADHFLEGLFAKKGSACSKMNGVTAYSKWY